MIVKKDKIVLNCILVFSLISLSIAYFVQYVLGHKPCNLCLVERYPYIISVILISFLFIINKFEKIILYTILLLFIFGAVVSFYHIGIEQGFFEESYICELGSGNENLTKENLLKQLTNKSPISCKIVTFRILGLSLATINTVISFILSGIVLKIIINYDKN